MSTDLKKYLYASVGLHVAVFIFLLFSAQLFRLLPKKETKITWVKLTKGTGDTTSTQPYKKVKDMPYNTKREQKEALTEKTKEKPGKDKKTTTATKKPKTPPPQDQKKTAKDAGINLDQKQKTETDRTIEDALARNEEMMKQRQIELEAAQVKDDGGGQSPVGSLDAQNSEVNAILAKYVEEILKKIQQEWITTPKAVAEGTSLLTKINVTIDSQGNILSTSYDTKSSDASFDMGAMRAIERSAPFPIPPEEIKNEVLTEGFLIEFNPSSVVGNGT
ncbi:TonB C-terminal domain-containing protein [bacterium]|nr:TonB C-terminal domain-containing protein [bacterium]